VDISIIIPYKEDRGFLKEALHSARMQNFPGKWEVVIQHDDLTMAQNTNEAVRKAKGEYVKWLHDDDMLLCDCLSSLWTARGADVIFANAIMFGEMIGVYKSAVPASLYDLLQNNTIHASTLMYKRKVLLDNPLDESLWTGEEYELNLRLLLNGYSFAYVDREVSRYRVHNRMKSYSGYGHVDPDAHLRRHEAIEAIRERFILM